jgi:hypothetical protein
VPCSGARRQDKVLDEVSAAIHGDAVAVNACLTRIPQSFSGGECRVETFVGNDLSYATNYTQYQILV